MEFARDVFDESAVLAVGAVLLVAAIALAFALLSRTQRPKGRGDAVENLPSGESLELPAADGLTATRTGPNAIKVRLSSPDRASFLRLLHWLPEGWDLHFYDQYYPSMSDPGAYIRVQRTGDTYAYTMGNHGWSAEWRRQSPELLSAWMLLNLEPKGPYSQALDEITVEKARRPWTDEL